MSVYSVSSLSSSRNLDTTNQRSPATSISDLLRDLVRLLLIETDSASLKEANIKAIKLISAFDSTQSFYDETSITNKICRFITNSDSGAVDRVRTIASQLINLNVTKHHGALLAFLFALRGRKNSSYPKISPSSELLLSTSHGMHSQSCQDISSLQQSSKALVAGNRFPFPSFQENSGYMSQPANGRVLLSIVQGISGATTAAGISLPHPADDLSDQQKIQSNSDRRLDRLAGVGWLCGRLRLLADQLRSHSPHVTSKSGSGELPFLYQLIATGIATAVDMHLADYTRLLATIESRCSSQAMTSSTGSLPLDGGLTSLTALRLETQLFAAAHQLRLLTGAVETVAGILTRTPPNTSSSILSYLYQLYICSSDDELKQCAGSIFTAACRPLYRCINAWLSDGRVPFGDFFIYCDTNVGLERFWADRFQLRKGALPSFISENLAAKMLLIGKAIHYATTISAAAFETGDEASTAPEDSMISLTTTCEYAANAAAATGLTFPGADSLLSDIDSGKLGVGRLACYVDAVYRQLAKDLLAVVIGSGSRLAQNLTAVRAFLLMARGDFAVRLVELAAPILDQPAERVFVPGLRTTVLDAALRSTIVEPNPHSPLSKQADRVDCRLLQASPRDSGWDVFRLEWRIDPRLAPVLSPDTMLSYARLSSLLVAMRHSHFALISVWVNCRRKMLTPRNRPRPVTKKLKTPVVHIEEPKIDPEISKMHNSIYTQLYAAAHELRTFVDQLHYYVYLEVVEPAFMKFRRYCESEESAGIDLDGVISQHKALVDSLLIRCLLHQNFHSDTETPTAELLDHLRNILQHCHTLAAISIEVTEVNPNETTVSVYRSLSARISLCQRTAREHVKALLTSLSVRRDPAQRCLAFRIDSSGFYSRKAAKTN